MLTIIFTVHRILFHYGLSLVYIFIFPTSGVDEQLARHVAHLFIRDPVASLCLEDIYKDDEESTDLFEVKCNTNITSLYSPNTTNLLLRTIFESTQLNVSFEFIKANSARYRNCQGDLVSINEPLSGTKTMKSQLEFSVTPCRYSFD